MLGAECLARDMCATVPAISGGMPLLCPPRAALTALILLNNSGEWWFTVHTSVATTSLGGLLRAPYGCVNVYRSFHIVWYDLSWWSALDIKELIGEANNVKNELDPRQEILPKSTVLVGTTKVPTNMPLHSQLGQRLTRVSQKGLWALAPLLRHIIHEHPSQAHTSQANRRPMDTLSDPNMQPRLRCVRMILAKRNSATPQQITARCGMFTDHASIPMLGYACALEGRGGSVHGAGTRGHTAISIVAPMTAAAIGGLVYLPSSSARHHRLAR